jgi:hypothetical protein
MLRKFLVAAVIAIIVIFAVPAFVVADTASFTVNMRGQAVITTGRRTTQIRVELKSSDAAAWYITLDLTVPVRERESNDERDVEEADYKTNSVVTGYDVRGYFTLGAKAQPLSSGTVVGTLKLNGAGEIKLLGQNESSSLSMAFTLYGSGAVNAAAEGQWPLIPSPVPSSVTTGITPPAIVTPAVTIPAPPASADIVPAPPIVQQPAQPVTPPPAQQPANHFFWYISRTSAMLAYILLFINICLGIGLKTKYLDSLMRRWRTFDLHQFTAILGGSLIILHIFSLLGDAYFSFTLSQLLVPMSSPYRPFWTALGSIALYMGAIIALSYYVRKIIGQKTWRVLHYISYGLFFVILFHGIMAGTDSSTVWVKWLYISTGTAAAFLFLWRFLSYRVSRHPVEIKTQTSSPEQSDGSIIPS